MRQLHGFAATGSSFTEHNLASLFSDRHTVVCSDVEFDEGHDAVDESDMAIAVCKRGDVLLAFGTPFFDLLFEPDRLSQFGARLRATRTVVFSMDPTFSSGAFAVLEEGEVTRFFDSDEPDRTCGTPRAWEVGLMKKQTNDADYPMLATEEVCGMDIISFAFEESDFTIFGIE